MTPVFFDPHVCKPPDIADGVPEWLQKTWRRDGHSFATIKVTNDRHGSVRAFAPDSRIGRIHVADEVWIEPPVE